MERLSDRTDFVPRHVGDNILPLDPLFNRLLTYAHRKPPRIVVRDVKENLERTHLDLLNDILVLSQTIRASLSAQTLQDLDNGKEVFIAVLAPGGYEFSVGILTALALGAAANSLSILQPVEEASYYIRKSKAVAVLTATPAAKLGSELEAVIRKSDNPDFVSIPIAPSLFKRSLAASEIKLSSNRYLNPNSAGLLIFTSGTTGPPKGAVLRRAVVSDGALAFGDQFEMTEHDVLLHMLPVHHATGIWTSFFGVLIMGACVEYRTGSFDPVWAWERLKKGGITYFSGVPTIYMRMMRHYQEHLSGLPPSELGAYKEAAAKLRGCLCGTSALPKSINDFWTDLRKGAKIIQRYGATETGVIFTMYRHSAHEVPDGSVGEMAIGVEAKLSEGDEGEILIRSYNMFSKYLFEPEATAKAHNAEGYYRTGDLARREGRYYWIVGRASVDIIKSGGYKISALDIEREILSLPYIGEAVVMGVADEEYGQRVGAVITLRNDQIALDFLKSLGRKPGELALDELRDDLRSRLVGYKLPTLLRVVKEDIPKTASGKVQKKVLGPSYFPPDYERVPEVQVWQRVDRTLAAKL